MSESFILGYVPQRIKQLGFNRYHLRYRDLVIRENERIWLAAYNELFFLVDDPPGIVVESDYGIYDSTDDELPENVHQHRGEIVISNPGQGTRRVKVIQIIIVN
ncbi:hypothetical protein [Dawidia soli]|uniref:Uncharacterized protein n=1 Tax=Dawidia soli TaxID=2782352 RepID=A0AAP2DDS4_9BACT|nr:hypothetical protein [Dawidia soli]MBT1688885.1 hypothetical protein [Dawidia soli]